MSHLQAFDEQLKSGDGGAGAHGAVVEDNWGLFTEAADPKFCIPSLGAHCGGMWDVWIR